MRIDISLIRQILLSIESEDFNDQFNNKNFGNFEFENKDYYSSVKEFEIEDIIAYHLHYLQNASLIENISIKMINSGDFIVGFSPRVNLTVYGHDFLDSIRKDEIFKKIKQSLSKIGGSATLDIVKGLGISIISAKLGI